MPFLGFHPSESAAASASSTLATTTTIGDGTAEDIQIRFDGNTLDYHIGLDDSGDLLTIGKGSALGTTTAMTFDTNGIMVKPLNSCFGSFVNTAQSNLATNTDHTIAFSSEVSDHNADYDNSNYIFTAPVTGTYQFNFSMRISSLDTASSFDNYKIVTSNATYVNKQDLASWGIADTNMIMYCHTVTDMDAGDTCKCVFKTGSGAAQADVVENSNSLYVNSGFSGYLVG